MKASGGGIQEENHWFAKTDCVAEGFMMAKKVRDYDIQEEKKLVSLVMEKTAQVDRLDERVCKLMEENYEKEMRYEAGKQNKRIRIQELRKELEEEKRKNLHLEVELGNTRERLLAFMRRSVPRRLKRIVRRIDL